MKLRLALLAVLIAGLPPAAAFAQFNYDESKVPKYTLPDPLVCLDGTKVTDKATWVKKRRPEIVKLFEEQVYGRAPKAPVLAGADGKSTVVFDGLATMHLREVSFQIRPNRRSKRGQDVLTFNLLVFLPTKVKGPVPTFLALNFGGNHTVHRNPSIEVTSSWVRNDAKRGITNHKANEKSRGASSSRWAIQKILKRGYGLATIYYGDIVPDHRDGLKDGPHRFYLKRGQTAPATEEWGAIAGWAWALGRALDYFEDEANPKAPFKSTFSVFGNKHHVDPKRVIVMGHSRLGKTALWAGAIDPRFAMVISNDSGCGGAALSRRAFGETVKRINTSFPHWFCGNFKKYNDNEAKLPVDQHMLISLIAPRPVYIASAQKDRWADPRGEFLSALHADPVYKLLGTEGLPAKTMPGVNKPVMGRIGYHIRTGKHDVTEYDWEQYLKFADMHLKTK
ncbi:MAG: acetylxylan esterase [Planctomycetaceae bacterium]